MNYKCFEMKSLTSKRRQVLLERIMEMERALGDRAPIPVEERATFQMYATRTGLPSSYRKRVSI